MEQLGDLSLYHVTIAGKPNTPELARRPEALIIQNPFIVSADTVFGSRCIRFARLRDLAGVESHRPRSVSAVTASIGLIFERQLLMS
jgi:hypothetical protein